jgi:pimeloyl-ACP methyl ester carboxylesterase
MRDMRANLGVFRACVLAVVALLCLQSGASAVPATPADGSHGFAAGAAYAADQPWTAQGDPAIVQKVVHFDNGDVHLTGTLFMPAAGDHLAAVVVLHPAEQPTRAYALYRHLTEGLPAMRMAVLVYDRRGSGQSSGNFASAGYEALADDAIAGAHAIAHEPRIDHSHIGYWGLSQGGWLSVVAAARDPKAAFAVSVSAPLVTASEQMHFANRNELYLHGAPSADMAAATRARDAWEGYLRGKGSRGEALAALGAIENKPWFPLTFMPRPADMGPPQASGYRLEMDQDPSLAVARVKAPMLFIFGGTDPWIPVALSVERLRRLAAARGDMEIRVIAGANHEMELGTRETMAFDKTTMLTEAPNAPAYFTALASWLARHAKP